MLLYSPAGHSVKDVALDSGKTTFDQERIIQEFIQKKVTTKTGIENIALRDWFLKDYLKSSKCTIFLNFFHSYSPLNNHLCALCLFQAQNFNSQ